MGKDDRPGKGRESRVSSGADRADKKIDRLNRTDKTADEKLRELLDVDDDKD